jgi:hypothetical protein
MLNYCFNIKRFEIKISLEEQEPGVRKLFTLKNVLNIGLKC